jgi:hypothetical protein
MNNQVSDTGSGESLVLIIHHINASLYIAIVISKFGI